MPFSQIFPPFPSPTESERLFYTSVSLLLSCVQLFATPWTAARQASLSITNSQSLLKLMSIESADTRRGEVSSALR